MLIILLILLLVKDNKCHLNILELEIEDTLKFGYDDHSYNKFTFIMNYIMLNFRSKGQIITKMLTVIANHCHSDRFLLVPEFNFSFNVLLFQWRKLNGVEFRMPSDVCRSLRVMSVGNSSSARSWATAFQDPWQNEFSPSAGAEGLPRRPSTPMGRRAPARASPWALSPAGCRFATPWQFWFFWPEERVKKKQNVRMIFDPSALKTL